MIPPDRRILPASQAILIDKAGRATVPMYDFMRRVVEATTVTPELLQQMRDLLAEFAALQAALEALELDLSAYTKRNVNELITGEWTFMQPILGADGTAERPEFSFRDDDDSGFYRIGDDNLGISTGAVLRWDVDTARVQQTMPLIINVADGASETVDAIQVNNVFSGGGIVARTISSPDADINTSNQLGIWENAGRPPDTVGFGFRWVLDGAPSLSGDLIFYSHNNSATGTEIFRHARDAAYMLFVAGTAAAPTLAIRSTNLGIYSSAANTFNISTNGTNRFQISTTAITSALQHLGTAGSAAAPSWSFSGDPNTGVYSFGADDLGFATGGILRLDISTSAVTSTLPWQGPSGNAGAPSLAFSGDPNTGIYSSGADQLGFAAGGTLRLTISTTEYLATLPWHGQDGSNSAPAVSFSNDPDTGVYRGGANLLYFATGGSLRFGLGAAGEILDSAGSPGAAGEVPTSAGPGVPWAWGAGGGSGLANLTYLTETDETADLPNSLQLIPGTNVTFDTSTPNQLVIDAAGASGAPAGLTYITGSDETASLPNSLQLIAGTGVTFDTSTPNELEINVSGATGPDVQVFTAGTTNWNKPSGATADTPVEVILYGAGGGGGGGAGGTAGNVRRGGGSGGGGAFVSRLMSAGILGATESVTVGAAGTAGTAGSSGNGGNGGNGGNTTFGAHLTAYGGGGGFGGTVGGSSGGSGGGSGGAGAVGTTGGALSGGLPSATASAVGVSGGGAGVVSTGVAGAGLAAEYGGGGGANAAQNAGQAGGTSLGGGAGGGSGGGVNAANTAGAGAAGGNTGVYVVAGGGGGAGGGTGAAGTAGTSGTALKGGTGGGGGGGNSGGTGGAGGAGGAAGGGGGGGGGGTTTGGVGGAGGGGYAVVITYL